MSTTENDTGLTTLQTILSRIGVSAATEDAPEGSFCVDLNNLVLGDPYFASTGWLSDRETAEGVAAILITIANQVAAAELAANPDLGWSYTGDDVADTYATIISAARDEWEEPLIEENFFADPLFMSLWMMPCKLIKVVAAIAGDPE